MQNEPDIIFPITMTFKELSTQEEDAGKAIVNAAYLVHKNLGPGLLEKVYEACIAHELRKSGFTVASQINIPFDMTE